MFAKAELLCFKIKLSVVHVLINMEKSMLHSHREGIDQKRAFSLKTVNSLRIVLSFAER